MRNRDGGKLPPPQTWQQRILQAASHAATAQDHPLYRSRSARTRVSSYSLALLDSLGKPALISMDINGWTGGIGQFIHINVRDSVAVLVVRVMIREHIASDFVFESGEAYRSLLNPSIWTYVTKTRIHQVSGFCIDILASDLAGNLGVDTMEFRDVWED